MNLLNPLIGSLVMLLLLAHSAAAASNTAQGPLRIHPGNPRYFTDGSGKAVYLTGSHTWNNLQDMGPSNPPPAFDFNAYLGFLEQHHHNFIRLWRWELVRWDTTAAGEKKSRVHFAAPHPWARPGPGLALDGQPKFNLEQFDDAYFHRLRERVLAARARGIYVAIMLFEGWGMQFVAEAWKAHPFHPANNVNGLDGDTDRDGRGLEIHALASPGVTAVQERYVRKVIDTVNDLDNVLYEISNENHPPSTEWQYHFIRFIQQYERGKPKQHPVGMTFQYKDGSNAALFASPAEWISPNQEAAGDFNYRNNPPAADGRKVILNDTDHLWGIGGDTAWVWKSFLRGLNPIFMDPYDGSILGADRRWEAVRAAMGHTRRFAERVNLAAMPPRNELATTGYCLADPGNEYLVYQPDKRAAFSVELPKGAYQFEWFDCAQGSAAGEGRIDAAGGARQFKAPSAADAVLYLKKVDSR